MKRAYSKVIISAVDESSVFVVFPDRDGEVYVITCDKPQELVDGMNLGKAIVRLNAERNIFSGLSKRLSGAGIDLAWAGKDTQCDINISGVKKLNINDLVPVDLIALNCTINDCGAFEQSQCPAGGTCETACDTCN